MSVSLKRAEWRSKFRADGFGCRPQLVLVFDHIVGSKYSRSRRGDKWPSVEDMAYVVASYVERDLKAVDSRWDTSCSIELTGEYIDIKEGRNEQLVCSVPLYANYLTAEMYFKKSDFEKGSALSQVQVDAFLAEAQRLANKFAGTYEAAKREIVKCQTHLDKAGLKILVSTHISHGMAVVRLPEDDKSEDIYLKIVVSSIDARDGATVRFEVSEDDLSGDLLTIDPDALLKFIREQTAKFEKARSETRAKMDREDATRKAMRNEMIRKVKDANKGFRTFRETVNSGLAALVPADKIKVDERELR